MKALSLTVAVLLAAGPASAGVKTVPPAAVGLERAEVPAPAPVVDAGLLPGPSTPPQQALGLQASPEGLLKPIAALQPSGGAQAATAVSGGMQLARTAGELQRSPVEAQSTLAAAYDSGTDAEKSVHALFAIPHREAAALIGTVQLDGSKVKQHSYQDGRLALSLKTAAGNMESTWHDFVGAGGKLLSWRQEGPKAPPAQGEEQVSVVLRLAKGRAKLAARVISSVAISLASALGDEALPATFGYEQADGSARIRYDLSAPSQALPAVIEAIRAAAARRGFLGRVLRLKEAPVELSWRLSGDAPLALAAPQASEGAEPAAVAAQAAALTNWQLTDQDASDAAQRLEAAVASGDVPAQLESTLREGLLAVVGVMDEAEGEPGKRAGHGLPDLYVQQDGRATFRIRHMVELYGKTLAARPDLLAAGSKDLIVRLVSAARPREFHYQASDSGYGSYWTSAGDKRATMLADWLGLAALGWLEQLQGAGQDGLIGLADALELYEQADKIIERRTPLAKVARALWRRNAPDPMARRRGKLEALFVQRAGETSASAVLPRLADWDAEAGEWKPKREHRNAFEALMRGLPEFQAARRRPK